MIKINDFIIIKSIFIHKGTPTEELDIQDNERYQGASGFVTKVDDAGQVHGTWGGIALIPGEDDFEVFPRIIGIYPSIRRNLYSLKSYLYSSFSSLGSKYAELKAAKANAVADAKRHPSRIATDTVIYLDDEMKITLSRKENNSKLYFYLKGLLSKLDSFKFENMMTRDGHPYKVYLVPRDSNLDECLDMIKTLGSELDKYRRF